MAVNLWYPAGTVTIPPGLGYLLPRAVPYNPEGCLGVFFDSNLLPHYKDEPKGTKLFALMGGHNWDTLAASGDLPSEADGVLMAQNILFRHLGIPVDSPCHAISSLARDCIPQPLVGHWELMRRAHEELSAAFHGRLAVAGGSFTSPGVLPAIRAGYEIAAHVAGDYSYDDDRAHIGDTGLAQFAEPELDVREVNKAELAKYCGKMKVITPDTWYKNLL